jgi:hypothetical protein
MAALGQSRQAFEILSKTLGFIPVVGENLKSAAELASKICEEIEVRESLPIIISPLIYDLRVVIDNPGESRRLRAPQRSSPGAPPRYLGRRRSGEASRAEAHGKEAACRESETVRLRTIENTCLPLITEMSSVLEEIQTTILDRVPADPPPSKASRRVFVSIRRALSDTKNMSADQEKIKNMERKLRDVMSRFGVRSQVIDQLRRLTFFFLR